MASSFDALPPEMVQKCVEFLDFDLVSGDLKGVSKATRGVARRALTRGRWKPFRYVAQQALAAVSEIDHRAFFREPPAAVCATCREAWALDPALVVRLICGWDTSHLKRTYLEREMANHGVYQGRLLWIVEPSQNGLSRIVAALEGTCLIQFSINVPHYYPADSEVPSKLQFFPLPMLNAWNWAQTLAADLAEDPNKVFTPAPLSLDSVVGQELEHAEHGPLVGRGLGAWSDPLLAARFTRKFHVRYGYSRSYATEAEMYFHGARAWSDDWVDRTKASAFVVEMARIFDASPYHYH